MNGSIVVWDTWNWSRCQSRINTRNSFTLSRSQVTSVTSRAAGLTTTFWFGMYSTGARLQKLHHTRRGPCAQVAFGPGNHLASGGGWSRPALGPGYRTSNSSVRASRGSRAWSGVRRGGHVISVGASGMVKIWDPMTGNVMASGQGQVRRVHIHGVSRSKRPAGAGRFGRVSGSLARQPGPRRASVKSTGTPRMLPAWPSIRTGLARVGGGRWRWALGPGVRAGGSSRSRWGSHRLASRSGSTAVNSPGLWAALRESL